MESIAGGGMMNRAVLEAVASVAAPEIADQLIAAALRTAGLPRVPETPDEAGVFVSGALCRTVADALGADLAEVVVDSLRPVVEVASGFHAVPIEDDQSGMIPIEDLEPIDDLDLDLAELEAEVQEEMRAVAQSEGARTREIPVVADAVPVVLVATLDRAGVDVIGRRLPEIEVRPVADMFEWMAGIEMFGGRRLVLVLDCCVPAVDPVAAARTSHVLPSHADVVLWGASDDVMRAVQASVGTNPHWHRLPTDADHKELAAFLASGL